MRSSSFESIRSLQLNVRRVRSTEYERQRRYNFLGRHPPPIQQRSTSLPRIIEHPSSLHASQRHPLYFGGPTNRPRPGYSKVPRFVPLEIRLNSSLAMDISPACSLCNSVHDAQGGDVVSCNHCGQHSSLDSSRSTRGGSEVPDLTIHSQGASTMHDSKRVIKAVGSKLKAVLSKGKENLGPGLLRLYLPSQ